MSPKAARQFALGPAKTHKHWWKLRSGAVSTPGCIGASKRMRLKKSAGSRLAANFPLRCTKTPMSGVKVASGTWVGSFSAETKEPGRGKPGTFGGSCSRKKVQQAATLRDRAEGSGGCAIKESTDVGNRNGHSCEVAAVGNYGMFQHTHSTEFPRKFNSIACAAGSGRCQAKVRNVKASETVLQDVSRGQPTLQGLRWNRLATDPHSRSVRN
jgi:hypothetical protein